MADVQVFFATNRVRLPDQRGIASFGDTVAGNPADTQFGLATVTGVTETDPSAGTVAAARVMNTGGIGPELGTMMVADIETDILVFVHGAANSFTDALQRAAYNANWINATLGGRRVVVLAFSWPSRDYALWNVVGDLVDYRHDQAQALASAPHCAAFLVELARFKAEIGQRRLTLLAHSMGNYVLGFGVGTFFLGQGQPAPLFNQVVLAAADELAGTFDEPNSGRLSALWQITGQIAVYYSNVDVLMEASRLANDAWRLGYDGPPNRANTAHFVPARYSFLDCTGNDDFTEPFLAAPDRTHQYYRQSLSARADVARTLKGLAPPAGKRVYDAQRNCFTIPKGS